jgi:transposase
MIVLEYKVKGNKSQFFAIDEGIRTAQFIRNKALRLWEDNKKIGKYDLNKYCAKLAKQFPFASKLNLETRQVSVERAWSAYEPKKQKTTQKQSNNYHKARVRYALKHLRVSRQRKEYAKRLAYCVIQSNDILRLGLTTTGHVGCQAGGGGNLYFGWRNPAWASFFCEPRIPHQATLWCVECQYVTIVKSVCHNS